jgi:hypothetical protein
MLESDGTTQRNLYGALFTVSQTIGLLNRFNLKKNGIETMLTLVDWSKLDLISI